MCHRVIRQALAQGRKWGMVAFNAAEDATAPRLQHSEVKPPSAQQVSKLLSAAMEYDPDFGAYLRVLAATGCDMPLNPPLSSWFASERRPLVTSTWRGVARNLTVAGASGDSRSSRCPRVTSSIVLGCGRSSGGGGHCRGQVGSSSVPEGPPCAAVTAPTSRRSSNTT